MKDLGSANGKNSIASAVNSSGIAAGNSMVDSDGYYHAAVFQDGAVIDIGTKGSWSWASGINDNGRVVGYMYQGSRPTGGGVNAFIYDLPNGPMRNVSPGKGCTFNGVNN